MEGDLEYTPTGMRIDSPNEDELDSEESESDSSPQGEGERKGPTTPEAKPENEPKGGPDSHSSKVGRRRAKASWSYELIPEKRVIDRVVEVDIDAPRSMRRQPTAMLASEMALAIDGNNGIYEPRVYKEARDCQDKDKWEKAMIAELTNIEAKSTWRASNPTGR